MKYIKKYLISIVVGINFFAFVLMPNYVSAGIIIVPCGRSDTPDAPDCTICHLAEGIYNIIQLITGILATTAVLIIVIAGIMYIVSAGNQQMVTTAKTAMKNALIGVVIVLTAFLIITFILNSLFKNDTSDLKVEEGGLSGFGGNAWDFQCK